MGVLSRDDLGDGGGEMRMRLIWEESNWLRKGVCWCVWIKKNICG